MNLNWICIGFKCIRIDSPFSSYLFWCLLSENPIVINQKFMEYFQFLIKMNNIGNPG